jgi:SAM-dependent methyltransferase
VSDLDQLLDLLDDDAGLVRAVASGRQRNRTVPFRRVELRYVDLKAGRRLQVTSYDDTQAHTRNLVPGEESRAEVLSLLRSGYASWHVDTLSASVQARVTKKGKVMVHRGAPAVTDPAAVDRSHDRAKLRRLDADDPLFRVLGVTASDGRVKPSRVAKFRQVQDLLAALDPVVDDAVALGPGDALSDERPLRVVDLGCGNAYLTFAAFRYLTAVKGIPVAAVGVDVKAQAHGHNADVAAELEMADHVRFVQSDIASVELDDPPDLVLALHACDTATDDALARAVRWETPVVVAAPCCHHDIQRQLAGSASPAPYPLVTRHAILRERFADVLTDALRAAILRQAGYRVDVVEFVDSAHTPRNALIRAVRSPGVARDEAREEYDAMVQAWGVRPALADRLAEGEPTR